MTHETKTPPPGAETAIPLTTLVDGLSDMSIPSLNPLYETRIMLQADKLDRIFHDLSDRAKGIDRIEGMTRCYGAAFKAQQLSANALETLMRLENLRQQRLKKALGKKITKRTVEDPVKD